MKRFLATFVVMLGIISFAPAAWAVPVIVNPDFNDSNVKPVPGWTLLDTFGGEMVVTDNGAGGATDNWLWLNSGGSSLSSPGAEQLITGLTTGAGYTINGFYKTHVLANAADPFVASVLDGATALTQFLGPPTGPTWTSFSLSFTAPGPNVLLRLQAELLADSDYGVDNFSIAQTSQPPTGPPPAPEPTLVLLLGAGLGGYAVQRQRARC